MDDKAQSLHDLALRRRESIVSQLVDIASQRNQQEHNKHLSFIKHLQCLYSEGPHLRRTDINAFHETRYIALSYTWDPSEYENKKSGGYYVERHDDKQLEASKVRNCILDRVISYMRHTSVQVFWIDRHCIRQDTCKVPCSHISCTENRNAVQVMDLVYKLSGHPIALLGRPLHTESELHLLACVLSGSLVDGDIEPRLRVNTIRQAREALCLLNEIIKDLWWSRAWTFQENYRGGTRMRLLIRHDPSLEQQKLQYAVFGNVPEELCFPSFIFSKEATRLCLALRRRSRDILPGDSSWIDGVLRATARYVELLPESSAMTPTVIADIETRGLKKPWDRLAIIANCCQYSTRLDGEVLGQQHHSLSLSVLAMCLLNGEILNNDDDGLKPVGSLKISEFLEENLFKAFSGPKGDLRKLTFNKGCRLIDVKLTPDGILTKGHLWKLGRIIDTAMFRRELPWIDNPHGRLELNQRKALLQLVFCLCDLKYQTLAHYIDEYLAIDADAKDAFTPFTGDYLYIMASELAAAIQARRKLRLGSIWGSTNRPTPYRAIFVCSDESGDRDEEYKSSTFVFTSTWPRDPGSEVHDANDIHHHVSLEVGFDKPLVDNSPPHLRVRSWVLGLCFFDGCPRTKVIFPWPRALQAVKSEQNR